MADTMSVGGGESPGRRGLRPLGVGETLDVAMKLYRNDAVLIWRMLAMVLVPVWLLQVIVERVALPGDVFVQNGGLYTFSGQSSSGTLAVLLTSLLRGLAQLLATGALFKLLLDTYVGQSNDWRQSLAFARHRFGPLLWLGIINVVLVAIGFILIIVPGLWFLVAASVSVPVLMMEGLSAWKSLQRSVNLVSGRWFATFGRLLAAFVLYVVMALIIGAITGAIERALSITNVTLFVIISVLLSAVVTLLIAPFYSAVLTVIYIDLRVRKEALDIELVATGYGAPGSTVPAGGTASPSSAAAPAPAAPSPGPPAPGPPSSSIPPPPPAPSAE